MKSIYRVTVRRAEIVNSEQILDVVAASPSRAEQICHKDYMEWRNGESSRWVRIVEPEQIVDSDLINMEFDVVRQGPAGPEHDPVEMRREKLNESLRKHGWQVRGDRLYTAKGVELEMHSDVRDLLLNYLAHRRGRAAAVGSRLSRYALFEYEYRFCSCFPDDEPLTDSVEQPGSQT